MGQSRCETLVPEKNRTLPQHVKGLPRTLIGLACEPANTFCGDATSAAKTRHHRGSMAKRRPVTGVVGRIFCLTSL